MTNFIFVTEKQAEHLDFDISDAENLYFEEISLLIEWTEHQDSRLFDGLTLQELLNLYRVSAEHGDIDAWFEEDPEAAVIGYNSAVNPDNVMRVSTLKE